MTAAILLTLVCLSSEGGYPFMLDGDTLHYKGVTSSLTAEETAGGTMYIHPVLSVLVTPDGRYQMLIATVDEPMDSG